MNDTCEDCVLNRKILESIDNRLSVIEQYIKQLLHEKSQLGSKCPLENRLVFPMRTITSNRSPSRNRLKPRRRDLDQLLVPYLERDAFILANILIAFWILSRV